MLTTRLKGKSFRSKSFIPISWIRLLSSKRLPKAWNFCFAASEPSGPPPGLVASEKAWIWILVRSDCALKLLSLQFEELGDV